MHPERKRSGEPEVKTPLGSPPPHFQQDEAGCWHEIAMHAPVGVLTSADRLSVEIAAELLARKRRDFDAFPTADRKHLDVMLGKFGLNPSDRAKLSIEKPKDASSFANLDD